jgi:hypothetical protein
MFFLSFTMRNTRELTGHCGGIRNDARKGATNGITCVGTRSSVSRVYGLPTYNRALTHKVALKRAFRATHAESVKQ